MRKLSILIVAALLPFVLFPSPAVAQDRVRVYTLSDGTKVVGEVVIDSGTHIMVKDPLTGERRTFERSLIVSVSDDLAEIESLRPAHLRFDHARFPDQVDLVVPKTTGMEAPDEVWLFWVPRTVLSGQAETPQAHDSCLLIAAPGCLTTPIDESGAFRVSLDASRMLSPGKESSPSVANRPTRHTALTWVEHLNSMGIYGCFADGQVRRLELATRNASGALALQESTTFGSARSEVNVPCGWVVEAGMSEPDLWVHALDAQYAEMERRATAASQMIRRAREVEESLASSIPVSDSRCGGDGVLSPNQRSMFTLSEEREYRDKLRRAQASVPASGTYMYRVKIEVACSTCTDGIKGYRRPTDAYVQAARAHVALLRRAERLANELVSDVRRRRDALRSTRAENYSRDAAITELEAGVQRVREWVSLTQEIDVSERRLGGIRP